MIVLILTYYITSKFACTNRLRMDRHLNWPLGIHSLPFESLSINAFIYECGWVVVEGVDGYE